jgi:hypothetical protein
MQHLMILLFSLSLFSTAEKGDKDLDEYLDLIKKSEHLGECGNYKEDKIEIVLEKKIIKNIEETVAKRLIKSGESKEEAYRQSKIGIVAKDSYWWWVRDGVIFPSGGVGSFNRIIKTNQIKGMGNNSVAILPITAEGKIVLNVMYRHAIRDFVLEIPRGKIEVGETIFDAAKRELKEETGMQASKIDILGEIIPDSGTTASKVAICVANIIKDGPIMQDYSEAILGVVAFSEEEIISGYGKGYLDVSIKGKNLRVILKDGYLSFALLVAKEKKFI